jgi:hypothetical protein
LWTPCFLRTNYVYVEFVGYRREKFHRRHIYKYWPTTFILCVTSRYLHFVASFAFLAPLFHWLRLSNLKLKSIREMHFCSLQKLQGFLRFIAGQFWSLKQLSLLSLPPYKQRAWHAACHYWFGVLPRTAESFAMHVVYIKRRTDRLRISKFEMRGGEQRQTGTLGTYLSPSLWFLEGKLAKIWLISTLGAVLSSPTNILIT